LYQWPGGKVKWTSVIRHKTPVDRATGENSRLLARCIAGSALKKTTPNRSTGYTPFFLVYGAEAVLPTDIIHDAPRVVLYTEEEAKEAREDDVDLLEEAREITLSRTAVYQQNLRRYHAQKVNPRRFEEGDLVFRLWQGIEGRHKLTPPWERPFIVSRARHNDAYYLIDAQAPKKNKVDRSGEETKRPWNIALLCPFYS
jgi:hypothetical protein